MRTAPAPGSSCGCKAARSAARAASTRRRTTRSAAREIDVEEIAAQLAATSGIEGLSLSGGEPLQQAEAAAALLDAARALGLSTLAFSGYMIDEIRALPHGPEVLARLDVLIDGRYVSTERLATGLRGSANQRIQLLTDRYSLSDVEATPVAEDPHFGDRRRHAHRRQSVETSPLIRCLMEN